MYKHIFSGAGSLSINDFQKAVSENKVECIFLFYWIPYIYIIFSNTTILQQLLIDIIKGKRITPFSDGYMTLSNKERARMKSASFGIAHHYLTDDDVSHFIIDLDFYCIIFGQLVR